MKSGSVSLLLAGSLAVVSGVSPSLAQEALMQNSLASITTEDFQAGLARVPEQLRPSFLQSQQRINQLTENMLVNRSLAELARKERLEADPAFARQLQLSLDKAYGEVYLAAFDIRKRAEFETRATDFEQRARELYAVDRNKYKSMEKFTVYHILVRSDRRSPVEARAMIDDVVRRIRAGEDFQALARELSEDGGTAQAGGELTFFRPAVEKPFGDAAFALEKPGDVSGVVETRYGFHVIKLKERIPERQQSFDEVREQIMGQLREKFVAEERERLLKSFFAPPGFKANEKALSGLRQEMPSAPALGTLPLPGK